MSKRVICIDDKNWNKEVIKHIKEFPVEGEVYTVVMRNHTAAGMGYILAELNNPPLPDGNEVGFAVRRFRESTENEITEAELKEEHLSAAILK